MASAESETAATDHERLGKEGLRKVARVPAKSKKENPPAEQEARDRSLCWGCVRDGEDESLGVWQCLDYKGNTQQRAPFIPEQAPRALLSLG